MADAAFAQNIPGGFDIAGGYYGGPNAYHIWPRDDWDLFPGLRLPFWVAGEDGEAEAATAAAVLRNLAVPEGSITALDMEERKNIEYVHRFGAGLRSAGYRVWVYGSESTVYSNPPLNGYIVADYGLTAQEMMKVLEEPHVRAIQYASYPAYDVSLVKRWTGGGMWSGS